MFVGWGFDGGLMGEGFEVVVDGGVDRGGPRLSRLGALCAELGIWGSLSTVFAVPRGVRRSIETAFNVVERWLMMSELFCLRHPKTA